MSSSSVGRSVIGCLLALSAAGCDRQSPATPQANEAAAVSPDEAAPAGPTAPVAGAVDRSHRGEPAPTARFAGLDGKPATMADLRGKSVLLNLWATWCAPCVAELPTLDRAAAALAGTVAVVALDQGEDAAKVRAFLATRPLAHARPLIDGAMAVSLGLGANLPTTILYDASGKEVWRVTGGRDWASAASMALIREGS